MAEIEEFKKVGLFDIVNDIGEHKKYLLDDDTQTVYNEFVICKAFSQHIDTILLADEVNKRSGISILFHHDYLFYSVDAKRRYGKWAKRGDVDDDILDYLKDRYAISNERAVEYMDLLSDDDKKQIETKLKTKIGKGI